MNPIDFQPFLVQRRLTLDQYNKYRALRRVFHRIKELDRLDLKDTATIVAVRSLIQALQDEDIQECKKIIQLLEEIHYASK